MHTSSRGFTLIELLVVIGIIGTLTSLLLANFIGIRQRAADATRKEDLRQLKAALRLYYNDNQVYPASVPSSGEFADSGTVYMKEVPENFSYYTDANEQFVAVVELENPGDEEIAASQTRCDVTSKVFITGSIDEDTDYVVCED